MCYNTGMEQGNPMPPDQEDRLQPYANKWVAVVHGRVAGVGDTAQQARMMARRNCPKDEPLVVHIPPGGIRLGAEAPDDPPWPGGGAMGALE